MKKIKIRHQKNGRNRRSWKDYGNGWNTQQDFYDVAGSS